MNRIVIDDTDDDALRFPGNLFLSITCRAHVDSELNIDALTVLFRETALLVIVVGHTRQFAGRQMLVGRSERVCGEHNPEHHAVNTVRTAPVT